MRTAQVLCVLSTAVLSTAAAVRAAAPVAFGEIRSTDQSTLKHENSSPNTARAAAVREAFQFAWDGYYKYEVEKRATK
jgi:hypothetical protein